MCNLSELIEERAMEKGIQKGTVFTLCQLVEDKILTEQQAAEQMNLSLADYRSLVAQISMD